MDKKEAIITIIEKDIKGIAIDPYYCKKDIGKIKKINYPNFKYIEDKKIKDDVTGREKEVWFIQIFNIPDNMIVEIKNTLDDIVNDTSLSIADALDKIIDYFRKVKFKKDIAKEIIGDLGEAIFLYKSLENGYNFIPYMRSIDNDIYDYRKDELYFEIKSSSLEKNEFILTHEQLEQVKNKKIIICKFKKVPSQINILDLYNMINKKTPLNDILLTKKSKWETIQSQLLEANESDLIANYSVILDNCKLNLFKDNLLPIIEIIDKKSCKKIDYYINCTDSEVDDINIFYKMIENLK